MASIGALMRADQALVSRISEKWIFQIFSVANMDFFFLVEGREDKYLRREDKYLRREDKYLRFTFSNRNISTQKPNFEITYTNAKIFELVEMLTK